MKSIIIETSLDFLFLYHFDIHKIHENIDLSKPTKNASDNERHNREYQHSFIFIYDNENSKTLSKFKYIARLLCAADINAALRITLDSCIESNVDPVGRRDSIDFNSVASRSKFEISYINRKLFCPK